MGCSSAKDDLELKMMLLKLDRIGIVQERNQKLKELEKITGQRVRWPRVPDYVVHEPNELIKNKGILNTNNRTEGVSVKKKAQQPLSSEDDDVSNDEEEEDEDENDDEDDDDEEEENEDEED